MRPIDLHLPNLSPPADEPIGLERARLYIVWIRQHVPPVLVEAERLLSERYPGAVKAEQLAAWRVWAGMKGLSIGSVWWASMAGSFAMLDIMITAEGRLVAKPGLNMRE